MLDGQLAHRHNPQPGKLGDLLSRFSSSSLWRSNVFQQGSSICPLDTGPHPALLAGLAEPRIFLTKMLVLTLAPLQPDFRLSLPVFIAN